LHSRSHDEGGPDECTGATAAHRRPLTGRNRGGER
jgi:hypothetical protein